MKQGLTYIVALLDKSGSMQNVQKDTIGGYNTFIEEQKRVPGEARITLMQFNHKLHKIYEDVPIQHVAPLTETTFSPIGWTSFNDSFAQAISEVGIKLSLKPEEDRPSKVLFLIMTDGAENTSKEFIGIDGLKKLNAMVNHQKDKYSWSFVYLGANLDSQKVSKSYGIDSKSAINYTSNDIGALNAFKSISRGVAGMRVNCSAGRETTNFFENESNTNMIDSSIKDTSDIGEIVKKYTSPEDSGVSNVKSESQVIGNSHGNSKIRNLRFKA